MQTRLYSVLGKLGLTLLLATDVALSTTAARQSRSLSLAYQRAIENVYRQHRIWPQERPDSKPSSGAVMSQAQLQEKIIKYLRNSQTLDDCQRPITADQLQTEMNRMAEHTKQPGVLREPFAALGNDPLVIAECLARPILSERLIRDFSHTATLLRSGKVLVVGGFHRPSEFLSSAELYDPATGTWIVTRSLSTARVEHTATLPEDGTVLVAGTLFNGGTASGSVEQYFPASRSWASISSLHTARYLHTATLLQHGNVLIAGGVNEASPDPQSRAELGHLP